LAEQGLLTEWDRSLFSRYCQEWKAYVTVCRKLRTLDDCTAVSTWADLIGHRPVGLKNRTYQNRLRIAAELGLSPSRTRLHVQAADEVDPLTEFVNR
jgi:P27 family predicted phage terminase small subunit